MKVVPFRVTPGMGKYVCGEQLRITNLQQSGLESFEPGGATSPSRLESLGTQLLAARTGVDEPLGGSWQFLGGSSRLVNNTRIDGFNSWPR